MSITEITNNVKQLGNAWEEFKIVNDRRLQEIENKGRSSVIDCNHIDKINHTIDECKDRLNKIEHYNFRPELDQSPSQLKQKGVLYDYIRKGIEGPLLEQKSIMGSNDDSGFPLTHNIYDRIVKSLYDNSVMRQVSSVDTISSDYITYLTSNSDISASWDENVTTTDLPSVTPHNIFTHTLHACPKITQRLLDDSAINIDQWITENLTDAFNTAENKAFFQGDGIKQPNGLLNNRNINTITTSAKGKLSEDDIMSLYYSLNAQYANNACFIMNRSTVHHTRSLKSSQSGQYIWQPGLQSNPDTLMGVPVFESSEMLEIAEGKIAIAFGDFKRGYKIIDHLGINILRDQFSCKPHVAFYATKRVGGDVFDQNAIKLLKIAKT